MLNGSDGFVSAFDVGGVGGRRRAQMLHQALSRGTASAFEADTEAIVHDFAVARRQLRA